MIYRKVKDLQPEFSQSRNYVKNHEDKIGSIWNMNGIGYAVLILQSQVSSGTVIRFGPMHCTFDVSMSQICNFYNQE